MPRQNLVGVIYLKPALCSFFSRVKHKIVKWQGGDRNEVLVEEDVKKNERLRSPRSAFRCASRAASISDHPSRTRIFFVSTESLREACGIYLGKRAYHAHF